MYVYVCICICILVFQWWCPHSSVLYGLRKNVTGRETSLEEDIKQGFLSNPAPENPDYDEDLYLDSYLYLELNLNSYFYIYLCLYLY